MVFKKVLGSLVWVAAVIRAGLVFFNTLLVLLKKFKRSDHSIHFSKEAKKDVAWCLASLK